MLKQLIYKVLKYFTPIRIQSSLTPAASAFIEAFPHPVFWIDRHKIYRGCNKVFADLMGLKQSSDIIGLKDTNLPFLPEILKKREEIFDEILNNKIPAGILYDCMISVQNETIWAQKRFTPLKNEHGKTIGVFGAIIDISEQVNRRKNLTDLLERKHIFEDFMHAFNNTPILSMEWGKLTEKAIIALKDIARAKLAIWAKIDATSSKESWHFATDQFDVLELFEKRDVISLKTRQGYLDAIEVNALKDIYEGIESIFFYRLGSSDVPQYNDIILLINPDEQRLEEAGNVIGFLNHVLHYSYIHKLLISLKAKRLPSSTTIR
jgi:hypothetical protein